MTKSLPAAPATGRALIDAEFLVVDCETNARGGDGCELTEVGTVLVGGGECHEEYSSLVAISMPLTRGAQRLTGITETMLASAPPPAVVIAELGSASRGAFLWPTTHPSTPGCCARPSGAWGWVGRTLPCCAPSL